jgi:hypothetical protein
MNSGKQLSFQYGEVSPSLRFRSDAVSYSQGLSKLKNMYVRNAGGVSNRAGFDRVQQHPFQGDKMVKGGLPGITGAFFFNPVSGNIDQLEYRKDGAYYKFYLNGVAQFFGSGFLTVPPDEIEFVTLKGGVLITPSLPFDTNGDGLADANANVYLEFANTSFIRAFDDAPGPTTTGSAVVGYSGTAPFLPVSYRVTALYDDGEERDVFSIGTAGYNPASATSWNTTVAPAATILHPTAGLSTQLNFTLSSAQPRVKAFNYYRAAGAGASGTAGNGFYKLAGRVPYDGIATAVNFTDFGSDDPSQGPPLEKALYGGGTNTLGVAILRGCINATYYQQRLIMSYDAKIATTMKIGDIGCSKLGAPETIKMPLVFSNTGAFQFNIPVKDSSPIVGFLPMERLIALTENAAYVIRGGEQGVLTPTSVNPVLISSEGGSSTVKPRIKGTRGFYLNNDHTKLMGIQFGVDGNLTVFEASTLSDHLLKGEVHKMEVTGGEVNRVWLLKRDGTMVCITVSDAGVGFATVMTDGFIENIRTLKSTKPFSSPVINSTTQVEPDVEYLYAYILRDGIRFEERLTFREDEKPEGFRYVDHGVEFGERLVKNLSGSYNKIFSTGVTFGGTGQTDGYRINLINGVTWDEGETITLESDNDIWWLDTPDNGLFIYFDDNGVEKKIRFNSAGTTAPSGAPWLFAWTGTFDDDVPVQLRDVETLNPSDKLAKQTRWLNCGDSLSFFGIADLFQNKPVSAFADGNVLSSPLNPNAPTLTVDNSGVLTLPGFYAWGVVGLPYESEMETLDLEASDGRTFTDANKLINAAGIAFDKTRGGFISIESQAAVSLSDASPLAPDDDPSFPAERPSFSDHIEVAIPAQWSKRGRVNVRQVDPLPLTVLSVYPKGMVSN